MNTKLKMSLSAAILHLGLLGQEIYSMEMEVENNQPQANQPQGMKRLLEQENNDITTKFWANQDMADRLLSRFTILEHGQLELVCKDTRQSVINSIVYTALLHGWAQELNSRPELANVSIKDKFLGLFRSSPNFQLYFLNLCANSIPKLYLNGYVEKEENYQLLKLSHYLPVVPNKIFNTILASTQFCLTSGFFNLAPKTRLEGELARAWTKIHLSRWDQSARQSCHALLRHIRPSISDLQNDQSINLKDRQSVELVLAFLDYFNNNFGSARQRLESVRTNANATVQSRANARLNLAGLYRYGTVVPVNYDNARHLYESVRDDADAAPRDRSAACYSVALMDLEGLGAAKNPTAARLGFENVRDDVNANPYDRADSRLALALMNLDRNEAAEDLIAARQGFVSVEEDIKAIPTNRATACLRLAIMDQKGLGGPRDHQAANAGFESVLKDANATLKVKASARLGIAQIQRWTNHPLGIPNPQNDFAAYQGFETVINDAHATLQDKASARLGLAKMKERGLGLRSQNTEAARELYESVRDDIHATLEDKASARLGLASTHLWKLRPWGDHWKNSDAARQIFDAARQGFESVRDDVHALPEDRETARQHLEKMRNDSRNDTQASSKDEDAQLELA